MCKCCCFIGHRKIEYSEALEKRIYENVKGLIEKEGVTTFLFGSRSEFDELCHRVITDLKGLYPEISRIYVRAEFPDINEQYYNYLMKYYEDTYFSEKLRNAGRAVYVERNCEMIDKSEFCIVYYKENYQLPQGKKNSGTKIAYEYAMKKRKKVILIK